MLPHPTTVYRYVPNVCMCVRVCMYVCACCTQEFDVFQIEIAKGYGQTEWRDDLKKVLKKAGMDGKDTVFVFTDTQIVQVGLVNTHTHTHARTTSRCSTEREHAL